MSPPPDEKARANEVSRRWEEGIEHDPRSVALAERLAEIDYEQGDDRFEFKFGGDGDNGEELCFLLDIYFASVPPAPAEPVGDMPGRPLDTGRVLGHYWETTNVTVQTQPLPSTEPVGGGRVDADGICVHGRDTVGRPCDQCAMQAHDARIRADALEEAAKVAEERARAWESRHSQGDQWEQSDYTTSEWLRGHGLGCRDVAQAIRALARPTPGKEPRHG